MAPGYFATFDKSDENLKIYQYDDDKYYAKPKLIYDIKATNNQKERDFPTDTGLADGDPLYTTPNDGSTAYPYIPGEFPNGRSNITEITISITDSDIEDFGPVKIRTDATRMVESWEKVLNEGDEEVWQKRTDNNGDVKMVSDGGLLIHGGGWSKTAEENGVGDNNENDTTRGCVRIKNSNARKIGNELTAYLKNNNIPLDVSE